MKKTVQVNLGGQVFTLDEDAYERLSGYLNQIGSLYSSSPGKDEILQDIEVRIAELFLEKLAESRLVIVLKDVEEVIEVMGRPEQFEMDAESEGFTKEEPRYTNRDYTRKRLFRDPDDQVIGGVCSGIGYYFGVDPLWIRLAFVGMVIFMGTGVLFYIILLIVVPEAKSASEKLHMKGEPVNIGSIGKTIEEELNAFGERISQDGGNFGRRHGRNLVNGIGRIINFVAELVRNIFGVVGKIIGVVFVILGSLCVLALLGGLLGIADVIHFNSGNWSASMDLYEWGEFAIASKGWLAASIAGVFCVIGIPFIALAYSGFLLLFPNHRLPYLGISLFGLWFVGLVMSIFSGFSLAQSFSKSEVSIQEHELSELGIKSDTVAVYLGNDPFKISAKKAYRSSDEFMIRMDGEEAQIGDVRFTVLPSSTDQAILEISKQSDGRSFDAARDNSKAIEYNFESDSASISLDAFLSFPKRNLFRDQHVETRLLLPIGMTVYLDRSMARLIDDIDNVTNTRDMKMLDHYWIMEERGLVCSDCAPEQESVDKEEIPEDDLSPTINVDIDMK